MVIGVNSCHCRNHGYGESVRFLTPGIYTPRIISVHKILELEHELCTFLHYDGYERISYGHFRDDGGDTFQRD